MSMPLIERLEKLPYPTEWEIRRTLARYETLAGLVECAASIVESYTPTTRTLKTPYLFIYYRIGGYEGGNCWSDRPPEYRHEPHQDIQLSDLFLELTGFQLKELKVETLEATEEQYYGNSTDYKVIFIALEDIQNLYKKYDLAPIIDDTYIDR